MTTQIITIITRNGEQEIKANVYGKFAVHRAAGSRSKDWNVTHVQTGLIVERYLLRRNAVAVAKALDEELKADFSVNDGYQVAVQIIERVILEMRERGYV